MESLLPRCLDSFILDKEYMDKLEVIIVNDGSKDNSSIIAHKYEEKFPNTYIVIDKLNGNYGSCVNEALKIATGKYFRLVDSDDWINTENFAQLIDELTVYTEQLIYTRFTKQFTLENKSELCSDKYIRFNYVYDLNKEYIPLNCLAMHGIIVATELLRNIKYVQTEGIPYTDSEFVFYSLSQATTLRCLDIDIYQYNIGRNEQTMNERSLVKNYKSFDILYKKILTFSPLKPNLNFKYLQNEYLYRMVSYMLDIIIIYGGYTQMRDLQLRSYLSDLFESHTIVFSKLMMKTQNSFQYVRLWYSNKYLGLLVVYLIRGFRILVHNKI